MPNFYIYLMSSLPFLKYGEKRPFSFDHFLGMCRGLIPDEDMAVMEMLQDTATIYNYDGNQETLKKWRNFEAALRNELVKIRASRKHVDPAPHLRAAEESDVSINHIAINAYRALTPLESEKVLDQARWHALDELSIGRYFEIDSLIIYACKLRILEKEDRMRDANNMATVEKVLS